MSSPKVAHVTAAGMALRYLLLNQLRSIQEAGYEVTAISSPEQDMAYSAIPALQAAGIRHIPVPMTRRFTPLADLVALWRLYRVMRRERFTIVHGHTPKAELLGQVAARLAGVPIVVDTFRGIYYRQDMHPLWRRLFVLTARIAATCADVVLSQSRENLQMAIREGICPPDKIRLLGNGIDMDLYDPARFSRRDVASKRAEIGLPADTLVVGFVGRLVREKGLLELFKAARLVREQVPNVRFVIVGQEDRSKPDALGPESAGQFGIGDVCHFLGWRHDMPELYSLMDLFVLPSHRESFPRAPMEASAMGIPCVVTDVPGCREAVEQGGSGLLAPLGDVEALAEAIVALLTDWERARRMGEEGRRLALERFDERLVFDRVKTEYARLLGARGLAVPSLVGEAGAVAEHLATS